MIRALLWDNDGVLVDTEKHYYRANRDQIVDPHVLHPGQRLAIPDVDPATRAAVRREAPALLGR